MLSSVGLDPRGSRAMVEAEEKAEEARAVAVRQEQRSRGKARSAIGSRISDM